MNEENIEAGPLNAVAEDTANNELQERYNELQEEQDASVAGIIVDTASNPGNSGSNQALTGKARTQFKPGQSGNPAGKPKGTLSFNTKLKRAANNVFKKMQEEARRKGEPIPVGFDADEEIIAALIRNAMDGREISVGMYLDRRFGKQKQTSVGVELPAEGENKVESIKVTFEE